MWRPSYLLLLFANALERVPIRLLIDELAGLGIPLCPAINLGIVGLGSITHFAATMPISRWRIGCHAVYSFLPRHFDAGAYGRLTSANRQNSMPMLAKAYGRKGGGSASAVLEAM